MSKYTTEVRYICETLAGYDHSQGQMKITDILERSWNKIFDELPDFFDESYKKPLCMKILRHFYTREIGAETYGLWKSWMIMKMFEIMVYYNQLYKSELLTFDPLHDVDLTTNHSGTGTNAGVNNGNTRSTMSENNTGSTNDSGQSWDLFNDTPQGSIKDIESQDYLTNARKKTDNGNSTSSNHTAHSENASTTMNTDFKTTDEWLEHVTGKRGGTDYADLLNKYRTTFINIDLQVIHEFDDLFMKLW